MKSQKLFALLGSILSVFSLCSEFLVADRKLTLLPVTASIFMSFISAILVLGNTAEMYLHGAQWYLQVISKGLGFFASAFIVVPVLYPLKLTSSFQVRFLHRNFFLVL